MNIPLNIDWQQICLHLLNFTILTAGLYFLLYKPVKDFMDKRLAHYREMEQVAQAKLDEAETYRNGCMEKLQGIEGEIAEKEQEAARRRAQINEEELQKAKEQADEIVRNAKVEAEREHERILESARKEVTDMVTIAARKLLLEADDSELYDSFLSSSEGSVGDE
ncbi:MAG: ATP synthase F0 subunit B [Roseburia sp.]|nr:ATP synthase F0 subunit B [Roseburia sp.]